MQDHFLIVEYLGEPEVLAQLAEEAAELAQAALKLRRAITGDNPTPKTEAECRAALLEEVADVELCLGELGFMGDDLTAQEICIIERKRMRWFERLLNGCGEGSGENG